MIQDTLFDPHPLADMWEQPEPFRETTRPLPAIPARPKEVSHCLHCGKVSVKMFCNAKCKTTWQGKMSAWQNRMKRTRIEGEQDLF